MNSFLNTIILFLILIGLAIILIYLQESEYFRDLIRPSPKCNNNNNNASNYQFANKSPYIHFLKNPESKYLGWENWWKSNQSKACVQQQTQPLMFRNYLDNKPLKYDGIWFKKESGNYYTWKLK